MSDVNCSMAQLPLISALDIFSHPELHNSHDDQVDVHTVKCQHSSSAIEESRRQT